MNILLLGGTGTLSSAVLNKALSDGWKVSIFNRGHNNQNIPSDVEIIKGDIKKRTDLEIFRHRVFDVVVDFLSRVPDDIERLYPIFKNICAQYIFVSSACVYRRADGDFPIIESSPKPNKDWNYNIQKYECEKKLESLSKEAHSYYTIVRPYITYDKWRIPLGIAPSYKYHKTIIERIRNGKPMLLWDNGVAITTVTHCEDFAKGMVGLFLNEKAKNEAFHITGDFKYTGKELLLELYSALGQTPNIISVPSNELCRIMPKYANMLKGDRAINAIFDNSKIKDAVPGLKFNIDIKEGLKRIIAHYDSMKNSAYDYAFDAQMDRVANHYGIKTKYCCYSGLNKSQLLKYFVFKRLPYKLANKLGTLLQ